MKVSIKIEKEVDLKLMHVCANVRYWEDGEVNGEEDTDGVIPCRDGNTWNPTIDIETGVITNWTKGDTASIHYKVVDCCSWNFEDALGDMYLTVENEYVPRCLSPKENGYGDYIIMDIDENGKIQNWKFSIDQFQE